MPSAAAPYRRIDEKEDPEAQVDSEESSKEEERPLNSTGGGGGGASFHYFRSPSPSCPLSLLSSLPPVPSPSCPLSLLSPLPPVPSPSCPPSCPLPPPVRSPSCPLSRPTPISSSPRPPSPPPLLAFLTHPSPHFHRETTTPSSHTSVRRLHKNPCCNPPPLTFPSFPPPLIPAAPTSFPLLRATPLPLSPSPASLLPSSPAAPTSSPFLQAIGVITAIGATTPAFTALFVVIITFRTEAATTYLTLVPVVLGIVIASNSEPSFHLLGVIMCFASTAARALKSVVQGLLLTSDNEKLHSMNLLLYMSPLAVVMLLPASLFIEGNVLAVVVTKARESPWILVYLVANAAFAYFTNLTNFLVTKHTSALTLQVLGNAKGVVAAIISVLVFRNRSWSSRSAIRTQFGLQSGAERVTSDPSDGCDRCCDCFLHFICHRCALCQEAREIRRRLPLSGPNSSSASGVVVAPPSVQAMNH
ncbi:unnamed protein product [Closterium sp. NIES-65]|nr:unnamed protein product [Closterium sp. NIES-65]